MINLLCLFRCNYLLEELLFNFVHLAVDQTVVYKYHALGGVLSLIFHWIYHIYFVMHMVSEWALQIRHV